MSWKLTLEQKIRAGVALLIVFLLIIATNQIDSHHFSVVKKSLTTVYQDRLLVKNYIYNISRLLDIKKRALYQDDGKNIESINQSANDSIDALISRFGKTYLISEEELRFNSLRKNLEQLYQYESQFPIDETFDLEIPSVNLIADQYEKIYTDLDALSRIQIEEGRQEIMKSNRSIDTSNLISRIEIGVLIIIGVLLQLLIFLKPFK